MDTGKICNDCKKKIFANEEFQPGPDFSYFHKYCSKEENQTPKKTPKKSEEKLPTPKGKLTSTPKEEEDDLMQEMNKILKNKEETGEEASNLSEDIELDEDDEDEDDEDDDEDDDFILHETFSKTKIEKRRQQKDSEPEIFLSWKKVDKWRISFPIQIEISLEMKKNLNLENKEMIFSFLSADNLYFIPSSKNCESDKTIMTLSTGPLATLDTLPQKIQIDLMEGEKKLQSLDIRFGIDMFMDDLFEIWMGENINHNILLWGASGSGKSCLINNVITATNNSFFPITKAIFGTKKTTKEVKSYSIPNLQTKQLCDFRLWDCPGLIKEQGQQNYQKEEFERIILGFAKKSMKIEKIIPDPKNPQRDPQDLMKMDCVIFVIDVMTVKQSEVHGWILETIKTKIRFCLQNQCNVIVALTKVDKINFSTTNFADNREFEAIRNKASSWLELPAERFFPIITLNPTKSKHFEMDRLTMKLIFSAFGISKATKLADHFLSNQTKTDFYEKQNQVLDTENKELKTESIENKNRISELEEELQTLKTERDNLLTEKNQLNHQNKTLNEENNQIKNQIKQKEDENQKLMEQNQKLTQDQQKEDENRNLVQQNNLEEIQKLKTLVETLEKEKQILKDEKQTFEKEKKQLQDKVQNLENNQKKSGWFW